MKTLKIILPILLLAGVVGAQCRTIADEWEFSQQVRITPQVEIKDYTGKNLYFLVQMKTSVKPMEMAVDDLTLFPPGFEKNYKSGRWFIFFCDDTKTILWVQRVEKPLPMESKKEQQTRLEKFTAKGKN
jgi:hypothetical protein